MRAKIKSLTLFFCLSFSLTYAELIQVAVTSKSRPKVLAVKRAFQKRFPRDDIEVVSFRAPSNVAEQPVGKTVGLQGAVNRMQAIDETSLSNFHYLVSIENFIEKKNDSWNDVGLILLKNLSTSKVTDHFTRETPLSYEFVELAKELSDKIDESGFSTTVGKAISLSISDRMIDPQDWHCDQAFGNTSRTTLLEEAIFKALYQEQLSDLKKLVIQYENFPKPGILFEDFFPLISDPKGFEACLDILYDFYQDEKIDQVVGLESRGFIVGAALAYRLGAGFTAVRKPGKTPGLTHSVTYQKEYGSDTLVIADSTMPKGARVLIVDDLIATGGSAKAAIELITKAGGIPVSFLSLLEVKGLNGRASLNIPSFNLLD